MNKETLSKFRILKLMEEHEQFNFPEFLRVLRKQMGLFRRAVANDVGISEVTLHTIEHGSFIKPRHPSEVKLLAHYYGIDPEILMQKNVKYIENKNKANPRPPRKKAKKKEAK